MAAGAPAADDGGMFSSTPSSLTRILVLAGLGFALAASSCGGSSAEAPAQSPSSGEDLTEFLLRDEEQPGFSRVESAQTESGAKTYARNLGLSSADADQLQQAGFLSITYQPLTSSVSGMGLTNVQLFATADGAADWAAHEQRLAVIRDQIPDAKVHRFTVSGVPGARGWIASQPDQDPAVNVYWVQGRCLLVLGNQGPQIVTESLSTGVRAIYARTHGSCP